MHFWKIIVITESTSIGFQEFSQQNFRHYNFSHGSALNNMILLIYGYSIYYSFPDKEHMTLKRRYKKISYKHVKISTSIECLYLDTGIASIGSPIAYQAVEKN